MNIQLPTAAKHVLPQAVLNVDGSLKNWVVYAAAGVACAAVGGALYYTVTASSATVSNTSGSPTRLARECDVATKDSSSGTTGLSALPLSELKRRGNEEYKAKSYAAAVECYTAAIGKASTMLTCAAEKETERLRIDIAACYQNRAAAYEQLKLPDAEIIEDCTRAIEFNKNYPKAWSRRARAYERMRAFDRALLDCTCAILLSRGAEAQWVEFGERVLQEYCTELAERLWTLKHKDKFGGSLQRLDEQKENDKNENDGVREENSKSTDSETSVCKTSQQIDAATKNLHSITLEQFLSHFNEDPVKDALRNGLPGTLANTSLQAAFDSIEKGEAQAAINEAQKFIEMFSNNSHMDPYWIYLAHNLCGTVWLSLEAMDNADRELSKVLAVSPEVLMQEGSAGGQGDSDAKQKWKRMLANAYVKKAAIVFSGQGAMENDNADIDEAFRFIQQAIATDPSASDSYVHRAQMYVAVQQYADALRSFEQALKIRPKDDKPLQAQAAFCRFRVAAEHSAPAQLGMHVESFRKRVNELDVIEGYQLLAQVYADLGAPAEALKTQTKCVQLDPRAAGNYVQRAAHNLMLDHIDDARRDLKKSIELDPFLTQAYETLISLEARMGQFEAADKVIHESVPYLHSQHDFLLLLQPLEAARAHHAAMKELKGIINLPNVVSGSVPSAGVAWTGGARQVAGGTAPLDISSLMSSQLE